MKKHTFLTALACMLLFASCTKEYIVETFEVNVYDIDHYSVILKNQKAITESIQPPYLKTGDTVAICATSNAVSRQEMENGINILKSWGLTVIEADNLYFVDGRYPGTVAERKNALGKLFSNPTIKAIIAARGGYGCDQLIPLDMQAFQKSPKWLVGYSDLTVLHSVINNLGIQSIHGPMANNFTNEVSVSNLKKALFGDYHTVGIPTNEYCIPGTAEGRLVGGNLTTFYALAGTIADLNVKESILFIEEVGEPNYNVDRMLTNLKMSGKLDAVKGIIVGYFSNPVQGIDKPIHEIILEKVKGLGIPVMYGVPAGHEMPNMPLYFGRKVKLQVGATTSSVTF